MNDIYFEMYNDMVMIEGLDSEEISAYYNLFVESKGSEKLGKKAVKLIEEIKNTKPSEFSGPIDVKQYVDKNYKILIDTAELLEKDVKNLRKDQVKLLLTGVIAWLGGFIVYGLAGVAGGALGGLIGSAKGAETAIIGASIGSSIGVTLGGIAVFFSIAYAIIKLIINYVKLNQDWTILKDLNKIKTSLKTHLKNKKLKDADRKKISKIIEVIDDAQEECNQKIIMSKESVDLIKLNIFESYDNGEITYGEKEYLLEKVDKITEVDLKGNETSYDPREYQNKIRTDSPKNTAAAAGVGAGLGGLIGAGVGAGLSVNKIRKIYDQQHADEMAAAEEAGEMDKYIAKREAAIKAASKHGAIRGASIGGAIGSIGGAAIRGSKDLKAYKNLAEYLAKESTFDLLLESINDLYDED